MELITMTSRELTRYAVIKNLLEGKINGTQAAAKLGLSLRQVKRIKARVKTLGERGIAHASRGRPGNHRIDGILVDSVIEQIKKEYFDYGPTLAQEYLFERDGLDLSVSTVRRIMVARGIWIPGKRKRKEYRSWRKRKDCLGELVQFDGSYHDWFETGEEDCLLGAIDDATGRVTARFAPDEGVVAVFDFWKRYIKQCGKPKSIYLDRLSTYKVNIKGAEDNLTQFERAMAKQLDVRIIHASSPQAKGRVEKLFGTLQDRLVKALRLEGIKDPQAANIFLEKTFLPKFNAKFAVKPAKENDLHRELNEWEKVNLDQILSVQHFRVVGNDYTVRFNGKWYQLLREQPVPVRPGEDIVLEERIDGSLVFSKNRKPLHYKALPQRPPKIAAAVEKKARVRPPLPMSHPWKRKSYLAMLKRKELVISNI